MTKPRWVIAPGNWWLDAVIEGVSRPLVNVTELATGSFEVHLARGTSSSHFVVWDGTIYTGAGQPDATRAVADEIWDYIVATYDLVSTGSVVYNGIVTYNSSLVNRGQLGID